MVGQDRALLGQVKSRKLNYFGHVTRHNSLEKDIVLGTTPGTRRGGGQRRQWLDNITHSSEMGLVDIVRLAADRNVYRRLFNGHSKLLYIHNLSVHRKPPTQREQLIALQSQSINQSIYSLIKKHKTTSVEIERLS